MIFTAIWLFNLVVAMANSSSDTGTYSTISSNQYIQSRSISITMLFERRIVKKFEFHSLIFHRFAELAQETVILVYIFVCIYRSYILLE